jgi:methyl-accepting chemotaxis protein
MGTWVTRRITRDLGAEPAELKEVADHISAGELYHPIDSHGLPDSVIAAFVRMRDMLRDISATVRQGADSVASASAQIATGNGDLSSRTLQQAASLQETAAAMEELGTTVKQNADNARQANQLALRASTVAIDGGNVVSQVVETMRGIDESSRKIADIISIIDGIAFQTNILALNAAVEAARAGEQGRGFAVVAAEVRKLSERSQLAAQTISELAEAGLTMAERAAGLLNRIVPNIQKTSLLVQEIAGACVKQRESVAQIGGAMGQLNEATQQNASASEQLAATSEELSAQAEQLQESIAFFKTDA